MDGKFYVERNGSSRTITWKEDDDDDDDINLHTTHTVNSFLHPSSWEYSSWGPVCTSFRIKSLDFHMCISMLRSLLYMRHVQKLWKKIENALRDDHRLTMDELSAMFPQISRSLLQETLGYGKMSTRWVPKQLTDQHKFNRVEVGQEFLWRYELHGDKWISPRLLSLYLPEAAHGWKKVFNRRGVKGEVEKWTKGFVGNYIEEYIAFV